MDISNESAKIECLREKIDKIDRKILLLLEQRVKLAMEIGSVKRKLGMSLKDPEREMEILQNAGVYKTVFERILEVCRDAQRL